MLSGIFLKRIVPDGYAAGPDIELHLGDNHIAVIDLAQLLQRRDDWICISVLFDGTIVVKREVSKLLSLNVYVNGALCEGSAQHNLQARDVLVIDTLQNCYVVIMDAEEEDEYDDYYRPMPGMGAGNRSEGGVPMTLPDLDTVARQLLYHNAALGLTHRSLVGFLLGQAAVKVARRNGSGGRGENEVAITPFSAESSETVGSNGAGSSSTEFVLALSHVSMVCYLFHVLVVYAGGGAEKEFYSLYAGDEEELVVCDRGAVQAQASAESHYRIASRPYTCLLEYVNLSAAMAGDSGDGDQQRGPRQLQLGYVQGVSVGLELLLQNTYAVLAKLSELAARAGAPPAVPSSSPSSSSPVSGPSGAKLFSASSPFTVWETYLARSGSSAQNYAQEGRVNSLNTARNALDLVTVMSTLVVDSLFVPSTSPPRSAVLSPKAAVGSATSAFYTYRSGVSFEPWVMMLAKILTFLSGVALTPPPVAGTFSSPASTKPGNAQEQLIGCDGDNGFLLNGIANFPLGFQATAGQSPTRAYVNYEVKSLYSILLCSLDIGNRYRRTDQGSLYGGQGGSDAAEEDANCRCEVCRNILQANIEVTLQTVLLLRVKYAFQGGAAGSPAALPLSKFTDDYLELVSKLRLRYAHRCVPGVSQLVCSCCGGGETGLRPSTPGKARGSSSTSTPPTASLAGSRYAQERADRELDLQQQLRDVERKIQESLRVGRGGVDPSSDEPVVTPPRQPQSARRANAAAEADSESAANPSLSTRARPTLAPLDLDECSPAVTSAADGVTAKPVGTPTGTYLKETISSMRKIRSRDELRASNEGAALTVADGGGVSNSSVSFAKPKSPTRIPRAPAQKSPKAVTPPPQRPPSPPVPALRAALAAGGSVASGGSPVSAEARAVKSNSVQKKPSHRSRAVTPARTRPSSSLKPEAPSPGYFIETPNSFTVVSVDSEGRLVKGLDVSGFSLGSGREHSSDSEDDGETWKDVGGDSEQEDEQGQEEGQEDDARLTSFCDDIVSDITPERRAAAATPPRAQCDPPSSSDSSRDQGRLGAGAGGFGGGARGLTAVATMSSIRRSGAADLGSGQKHEFLRRTNTGFGGGAGVSRSLFNSNGNFKEELAAQEVKARAPPLTLYASPAADSVLARTHRHLFPPFAAAPYHAKNRREATELLNTIENSTALWIVFYYYAKRQNSRDGQAKLRKEVTRSYLSCLKQPPKAPGVSTPSSPSTPANGAGPLDPEVEAGVNNILAVLPGATDHLGDITSTDVSTNNGTGMPSATYNSITSEKFHILSPVTVLQFLKEFDLLPSHLRVGPNGTGTPGPSGAYCYLYSLFVGVVQEAVTLPARSKHHLSPTSALSAAGSPPQAAVVAAGSPGSSAKGDLSGESGTLDGERQLTMPVGVVVAYLNFLMFQKIIMNLAVELQYNRYVCRNMRKGKGGSSQFSATPEQITPAMRQRQQLEAMERIHSRRQDNAPQPTAASAQAVQRKRILASLANAGLGLTPSTPGNSGGGSSGSGGGSGTTWKPRTPDTGGGASECVSIARDGTIVVDAHKALVKLLKILNAAKDRTKAISNASHNRPVFVLDL